MFLLALLLFFSLPAGGLERPLISEFIFDEAAFPECHAATIVEAGNGDFLAAWFGGTREGANDVAIWMSRRSAGQWSPPREVAREAGVPTFNPVLFRGPGQHLRLFYKFGPTPRTWTAAYKTSADHGKTWSKATYLPAGLLGPIKNKPIRLSSGDIVAGTSVESYQSWAAWVERSTDEGWTWSRHGPIVIPGEPYGLIQPAIVELRPNTLRMFVRTRQASSTRRTPPTAAEPGLRRRPLNYPILTAALIAYGWPHRVGL